MNGGGLMNDETHSDNDSNPGELTEYQKRRLEKASKRAWSESYGQYINAKTNWQRIAFLSMLLAFVSVVGIIYLGTLPKQVAIPIEVDKSGHVVYPTRLHDRPLTERVWDEIYMQSISTFIVQWRSVVAGDPQLRQEWYESTYSKVGSGSQAKSVIDEFYQTNSPDKRALAGNIVVVNVDPPDRMSDNSYAAQWTETTFTLDGHKRDSKKFHATFSFVKKEDVDFLITEIRINEVRNVVE